MSWKSNPTGDSMTTTGLLIVGGAVLFSHFLFPLIWWNMLGGREMRAREYQMLVFETPTPARPVLPIVSEEFATQGKHTPVLPIVARSAASPKPSAPTLPAPYLPLIRGHALTTLPPPVLPLVEDP